MSTIRISVQNNVDTQLRESHRPTVYTRVLRYMKDRSRPGKVVSPGKATFIYAQIDDKQKVLGAVTLNTGGSVSFFPDVRGLSEFDHFTLSRDFDTHNAHMTVVQPNGKHRITGDLQISLLDSGDYHFVTLAFASAECLMDRLSSLDIFEMSVGDDDADDFVDVLADALRVESFGISFPEGAIGNYFVQLLVSPCNRKEGELGLYLDPIRQFIDQSVDLEEPIFSKRVIVPLGRNATHVLAISAFRLKGCIDGMIFCYGKKK